MPYIMEICVAGKITEVCKYHSWRWNCKGEKRRKRQKGTTECQEKVNQRQAVKKLRRYMNANFADGDYLATFDFRKEARPKDSRQMQDITAKFIRDLRKDCRKENLELKYIYVKELGPRGAAHIHMVMTEIPLKLLRKNWKHGGIDIKPLNTDGQYEKIAEYFIKYSDKTIKTEGKLIGKRWYASRNLARPAVTKKVIRNVNTFYEKAREKAGYYVEPDSVQAGVTELGYGYFSYTLHRIDGNRNYGEEGG